MLTQLQPAQDPHIDHILLEKLRRLMEPEAFRTVLESFLDRSRIHVGNAQRCLVEGDLEKLKFTVHSIKGSGANVGLAGLAQLCADLEKQIKQGENIETLRQCFELVSIEYEADRHYLLTLTRSLSNHD